MNTSDVDVLAMVKDGVLVSSPGSGLLMPAGSRSTDAVPVSEPRSRATVPGSGSVAPVPDEDTDTVPAAPVPEPRDAPVPDEGPGTDSADEEKLTGWKKFALFVTVILAVALFAYAGAGSYTSVGQLARGHHVPLPTYVPLGIDGSLVLALLADIVLTWIGHPIWWLRAAARGFVAGSVAANAAAGWPDPIAVFLHCFPPIIIMLVTEAGRVPLLRKYAARKRDQAAKAGRDGIPWERWLAAPLSTAMLWRRMALWGEKSYEKAVTAEVTRRRAIMQLRVHYGRHWGKHAPGDLVWLLRTGNRLEEACAQVAVITAKETGTGGNPGTGTAKDKKAATGSRNPRTRNPKRSGNRGSKSGNPRRNAGTGSRPTRAGNRGTGNHDPKLLEDVRRRITAHREEHGRDLTVAELAIALGRRKTVAGELMRAARAQEHHDQPTAEARS